MTSVSTPSKPVTRGSTMAHEAQFASPLALAVSPAPRVPPTRSNLLDEKTEATSKALSPTNAEPPSKVKRRRKPKASSGEDPLAAVHLATESDPLPPGQGHLVLRPEDTNDYAYGHLFKNFLSKHKNCTEEDIVISLLPVSRLATPRYTLQNVVSDEDVLTALWYYRESLPCWVFGFDLASREVFVWGQNRKPLVSHIVRILPSKWDNLKPRLVDCYRHHYQDPSKKPPRVLHFIRYHSGMRFARWWREKVSIPRRLRTLPRFDLREVLDANAFCSPNEANEGPPLKRPRLAEPQSQPQQQMQPQPQPQPQATPARPVAVTFHPRVVHPHPSLPPPPPAHPFDILPKTSTWCNWFSDQGVPVLRITVVTDVRFPPTCGLVRDVTHRVLDSVVTAVKQLSSYAQPVAMAANPQHLQRT